MQTIVEFAAAAGVSRQAVYKALRKGLLPSKEGLIDETSPEARAYLDPRFIPRERTQGKPQSEPNPPKTGDEERGGFRSKAELEIHRLQQQIVSLKLRNQETLGHLIPREKVERLIFQPISVAHQRMLSDGAKAIAAYLHPYIAGGATVQECEVYIRKQLSGFIKAAKRDMRKVIEDAGD